MKILNGIIESEYAPSTRNSLWLCKGSLKYFGPNGWANINMKGATLSELSSPYILPSASTTTLGGVKKAINIDDLPTDANLSEVVTKVNAILSALKVADIMVKD